MEKGGFRAAFFAAESLPIVLNPVIYGIRFR